MSSAVRRGSATARLIALIQISLGAASAALAANTPPASSPERPNILFIAIDDLNTRIGPYGDGIAVTPNLDRLAAQGLTFLNHHVQWSVCGPSRACLTTGLMPEETGVIGFRKIRDVNRLPNVVTLPQYFRSQGYETAATGKFHDLRTVGTPSSASPNTGVANDGRSVDDPASWSLPYVAPDKGYAPEGKPAVDAADLPDERYEDRGIADAGARLLLDLVTPGGSAPGDKPFFLAVGFKKPHLPFYAPKRYWDLYDRSKLPLAGFARPPEGATSYTVATLTKNSELLGGDDDSTNGYEPYRADKDLLDDPARQRELTHGYYACISFIDALVGRLLDKLDATDDPRHPGKKLAQTTLVVLWGDHGFHLGEHGHWAKHTLMDAATGAPLIIRDPRRPRTEANNKTASPAGTLDIYPTLCDLAGLPVPEQPSDASTPGGRPLRGRSLAPLFADPAAQIRHGALSMFSNGGQYGYAYRTERFRYIEWVGQSGKMNDGKTRRELYDLKNDPLATRNVINDPAYAADAAELARQLRADSAAAGAGRLQNAKL